MVFCLYLCHIYINMTDLIKFEDSTIVLRNNEVYATRKQVQELYDAPRKTLEDNINKLKSDGLVSGAKIRHTANDNKNYEYEVYDLDEIIAIGFRLRSDKAIKFQRWAISVIKTELIESNKRIQMQQAQLDYFWDKSDQNDLYK
jgi:hypothetical protein